MHPVQIDADAVTDWIGVKVGYSGMLLDEYITVGDYHISEIESALYIYEDVYSYFQGGDGGTHVDGSEYTAVVDSARGFLISDLLDYAHIYQGDVYNLKFYVMDHVGIRSSFDYYALFRQRYYFDDMPGHREILYDDILNAIITGYNFDEAWNYANTVEPMLAIEDNWATFNEEFEHIGSDFSYMNTSSRFRLLFGQTAPTESLTSMSDKYVRWVYVTLYGQPEFGEMPELDNTLGSHTVEMTVTAYNDDVRNALSEFMRLYSSNEEVLVITGVTVTPSDIYSDLATITISYDIVGEGEASIMGGFGSNGTASAIQASQTVIVQPEDSEAYTEPENSSEQSSGEDEEGESQSGSSSDEDSTDGDEKESQERGETQERSSEEEQSDEEEQSTEETTGSDKEQEETSDGSEPESITMETSDIKPEEEIATEAVHEPEQEISQQDIQPEEIKIDSITGLTAGFLLSQDVADLLDGQHITIVEPQAAADIDIDEVKIEDRTEEQENRQRQILIFTGLGCLAVLLLGGAFEFTSFQIRLKKNI